VLCQTAGLSPPLPGDFATPLPWQRTGYTTDLLHGHPGRLREVSRLNLMFSHHLAGGVTTPGDGSRRLLGRRPNVALFSSTSGLVSVWVDQDRSEVLTGTLPGRSYEDIGALVTRADGRIVSVVPGQQRPLGRLAHALYRRRTLRPVRSSFDSVLGGRVQDYPSAKHAQVRFIGSVAAMGVASYAAAHNVAKLDAVAPVTTTGAWALVRTVLAKHTADKNAVHFDFSQEPGVTGPDLHNRSFDYITKLWDDTPGVPPGFARALGTTAHTPELERRLTDAFEACRRSAELRISQLRRPDGSKLPTAQRSQLMSDLEARAKGVIAAIPKSLESGQPLDRRAAMLQYVGGAGTLVAGIEINLEV